MGVLEAVHHPHKRAPSRRGVARGLDWSAPWPQAGALRLGGRHLRRRGLDQRLERAEDPVNVTAEPTAGPPHPDRHRFRPRSRCGHLEVRAPRHQRTNHHVTSSSNRPPAVNTPAAQGAEQPCRRSGSSGTATLPGNDWKPAPWTHEDERWQRSELTAVALGQSRQAAGTGVVPDSGAGVRPAAGDSLEQGQACAGWRRRGLDGPGCRT
jgi:hypothetical protein